MLLGTKEGSIWEFYRCGHHKAADSWSEPTGLTHSLSWGQCSTAVLNDNTVREEHSRASSTNDSYQWWWRHTLPEIVSYPPRRKHFTMGWGMKTGLSPKPPWQEEIAAAYTLKVAWDSPLLDTVERKRTSPSALMGWPISFAHTKLYLHSTF